MDKLEQVFISSTYTDLHEERQAVIQTLLEADCIPAGMEMFPASDDDRWTLIKRVIDNSDYYIVIVGGRYGSVDDDTGLSYTEMEFDYAVSTGTPVMGFVHRNPDGIAAGKSEKAIEVIAKLEAFKTKVQQRMCKFWATPEELGGQVAKSLIQIRKSHPAVGWVRGDQAITAESRAEVAELRERVAELEMQLATAAGPSSYGAPVGVEDLSQGEDLYEIIADFSYYSQETGLVRDSAVSRLPWRFIFTEVAPVLLDEGSEEAVGEALAKTVEESLRYESDEIPHGAQMRSMKLDVGTLPDVVVQLFALGLTERGTRKRGVNDRHTYWKLTPYGEAELMRLRAKRRGDLPPESDIGESPE